MEFVHIKGNTYYIKNATNIGIYKIGEKEVYIIDAGNDKEAGKKILKIIESQGWNVVGVISTHSNADHIGGNKIIQDRTGAKIYSSKLETCLIENPILEPSFLYGGYPFKELQNKFLLAKESTVNLQELPNELEVISLKGHFFDMLGIKTADNVYFLGDSLFSEETIEKYHVFFLYDIKEFLNTLDYLETLEGDFYVPSHASITNNIHALIAKNREKVEEIIEVICDFCKKGISFETLLSQIFEYYHLTMNINQYVLIGSTIKSYLSYLKEQNKIDYEFQNMQMIWKTI